MKSARQLKANSTVPTLPNPTLETDRPLTSSAKTPKRSKRIIIGHTR